MRTVIKVISLVITFVLFWVINGLAFLVNWRTESQSPFALALVIGIVAAFIAAAVFLILKSRRGNKIKL